MSCADVYNEMGKKFEIYLNSKIYGNPFYCGCTIFSVLAKEGEGPLEEEAGSLYDCKLEYANYDGQLKKQYS